MSDIIAQFESKMVEKAKTHHTREEMAIIWVIKAMNEMVEQGIMKGGSLSLSERGLKVIEDFHPTRGEIRLAIQVMGAAGHIDFHSFVPEESEASNLNLTELLNTFEEK